MQIQATSGGATSLLEPNSHRPDKQVQSVFAEVLAAVGRQGYVSAPKLDTRLDASSESGESLSSDIQTAWNDWFGSVASGRYSHHENASEIRDEYGKLLQRAHAEGGYATPQQFLALLSPSELEVIQRVQNLAQPIDVSSLTEEGALNLLLPPATQVDMDGDGITMSGAGRGLRFPDSNTPAEVVRAWEEATAGMPVGDRMTYELRMASPVMMSNMHATTNGADRVEPGTPAWQNPRSAGDYSYVGTADQWLEYLDHFQSQMPREQYESQKDFWSKFRNLLDEYGAQ
jgi:hypothetical protein